MSQVQIYKMKCSDNFHLHAQTLKRQIVNYKGGINLGSFYWNYIQNSYTLWHYLKSQLASPYVLLG